MQIILEQIKSDLEQIKARLDAQRDVLHIDDVCVLTGLRKSHIYKLTSTRKIPYYKPSAKNIYFKRTEIEEWLLTNKVLSGSEIQEQALNHITNNSKK